MFTNHDFLQTEQTPVTTSQIDPRPYERTIYILSVHFIKNFKILNTHTHKVWKDKTKLLAMTIRIWGTFGFIHDLIICNFF